MNVPKLRFKEFNDEWNYIKLSKISKKITLKNKNSAITNVISNSAKFGLISQTEFFDKEIANNDNIDNYFIIEYGDFVYNPRKSLEAPYGPINMYKLPNAGVISPLYLCFNIFDVNKLYLEWYFKSNYWHRYIYLNGDSGARHDRVSIKDDIFFDMNIGIPTLKEQEKIGTFLSLLDKKIELQSKKIEDLKLYTKKQEKYILDKIKNDTSTFKCNIENICSIQTGKSNTQDKDENGIYPFYIRSEQIEHSNKYIFNCEAVLTIGDGNIGKVFFYTNGKFDCHQRVYVMNNFSNNILGKYFYYYFSNNFYKRAKLMSAKNTVDSVRQEMISKMNISIPPINKQKEIVKLFDILENKVNLEISKLSKLELLKKGLMQNMFI